MARILERVSRNDNSSRVISRMSDAGESQIQGMPEVKQTGENDASKEGGNRSLVFYQENLSVYEKNRRLYDALTKEAESLRGELFEACKAFSQAIPSAVGQQDEDVRMRVFELLTRDLHAAHEELHNRLMHLSDDLYHCDVQQWNQKLEDVRHEKEKTISDWEKKYDELKEKYDRQVEETRKLEKRIDRITSKTGDAVDKGIDEIKKHMQEFIISQDGLISLLHLSTVKEELIEKEVFPGLTNLRDNVTKSLSDK